LVGEVKFELSANR